MLNIIKRTIAYSKCLQIPNDTIKSQYSYAQQNIKAGTGENFQYLPTEKDRLACRTGGCYKLVQQIPEAW